MQYRNDNQIAADIKAITDGFLQSVYSLKDWQTLQMYQREQDAEQENVVRFFTVSLTRMGWQGRDNKVKIDGKLYRIERWRETRRVQFDCLLSRKLTDTTNTVTAVDVARMLVAFFNGFAATQAFKELGYNRLVVKNVRIPVELDDTDRFRLYPGFDLILVYDQELTSEIESTVQLQHGIYPI